MAIVASLLVGAAAAAAEWWVLLQLGIDPRTAPPLVWAVVGMPFAAALLTALASFAGRGRSAPAPAAEPGPPPEPAEHTALRLLATLQEDGRLIDFLTEDVSPYSDEQIGAATRGIHADCMKALGGCVTLARVLNAEEDAEVTVDADFDPAAIRLTGNVAGAPPFRGVLRHAGWKAVRVEIPARSGVDPTILAPAEVEIP